MRFILKTLFLLLCSALISSKLSAQSVGLVLSGGGAKGLYHIGIIKALEENGIPIDYVAGTSMGSIVAAMYSAGYSVDDMIDIFESGGVKYWLTGKIEDHYIYYYNQEEPSPAIVSMDVDLVEMLKTQKRRRDDRVKSGDFIFEDENQTIEIEEDAKKRRVSLNLPNRDQNDKRRGKSKTPASMYPATQLDLAMMNFFAPASAVAKNNFDSLFVPFRCVSTDIINRKQYVWKDGDLGMAVRSSMAIPIVFKPVTVDSMLMYDGGIVNNFPWRELDEEFEPDLLIGGKCVGGGTPDLSTIPGQIEMLVMTQTDYDIPEEKGVMIERNVGVGLLDFSKPMEVINRGYEDAMKMMPQIKERVSRRVTPEEVYIRRLAFQERIPILQFDSLHIAGLSERQNEYVEKMMMMANRKDSTISYEKFKSGVLRTIGDGALETEYPISKYDTLQGLFDVELGMTPKPSFKAMLGVNISSTAVNQAYVGLVYRRIKDMISTYRIDGYIGSYYSSVKLSSRHDIQKASRPFYVQGDICYNYLDYARGNTQSISYEISDVGFSRYNDTYVALTIGTPVQRSSKLELRVAVGSDRYRYYPSSLQDSEEDLSLSAVNFATANGSLSRNSQNYMMYPTRGIKQTISLFGFYNRENYQQNAKGVDMVVKQKFKNLAAGVSFIRDRYINISDFFTIGYLLQGAYITKLDLSGNYMDKMLSPAFTPTEHSKTLYLPEFRDRSFMALGVMPIFEFNEKLYLKSEFYCYKPNLLSYNNVRKELKYILSLSGVYQSPIGAISLNYSRYFNITTLKANYYTLNVGIMMFNKKGVVY